MASAPQVGEILDGYRFIGGDPSKEESWQQFGDSPEPGDIVDGYTFKGGDPSSEASWEKVAPPKGLVQRLLDAVKPEPKPEPETAPVGELALSMPEITDPQEAARAGQEYWTGGLEPAKKPKTGSVTDNIPSAPRTGPPVRPEVRNQLEFDYLKASPEQRAAMESDPSWRGQATRLNAPGAKARQETLYRDAIKKGATPENAKAFADRNAVVADESDLTESKFDFGAREEFKDAGLVERAAARTRSTLSRSGGGAIMAAMEFFGADPGEIRDVLATSKRREEGIGEGRQGADYFEKSLENTLVSIGTQAPALARAVLGGGAGIGALLYMGATTAGQEYADGRAAGLKPDEALARASAFGAAEVIGERFGLNGFANAFKAAMAGRPAAEVTKELARYIVREVPGELLTTTLQAATDKMPGIGLNQEAGLQEFVKQLGDTVVQTVMQVGITSGSAMGARRLVAASRTPQRELADAINASVSGASINPQGVDAAAVEALRNPAASPVADIGPASAAAAFRNTPQERPYAGSMSFVDAAAAIGQAATVDEAIAIAGAALDTPSAATPQTGYGQLDLPVPPLVPERGYSGQATGEKSDDFLAQEAARELQTPAQGGEPGLAEIAMRGAPTQAGGVVSGAPPLATQQAEAVEKRSRGELLSQREVELAKEFDEKPAPKIVIAGRETDVGEASDAELAHAANLTRSQATRQIIVEEQRRRQEAPPAEPPRLALPDNRAASGQTLVTFPDGSAMPAAEARARQLQTPDTQAGARKVSVPASLSPERLAAMTPKGLEAALKQARTPEAKAAIAAEQQRRGGTDIAMAEPGESPLASRAEPKRDADGNVISPYRYEKQRAGGTPMKVMRDMGVELEAALFFGQRSPRFANSSAAQLITAYNQARGALGFGPVKAGETPKHLLRWFDTRNAYGEIGIKSPGYKPPGADIATAPDRESPKASAIDRESADYLNERAEAAPEERATSMDIARGERKVSGKGYFERGELQETRDIAENAGRDADEVEAEVRRQKARHPVSDGWAPLRLAKVDPTKTKVAEAVTYKIVPWTFHLPPGVTKASKILPAPYVEKLASGIVKEVRETIKAARSGDKSAQAIVDQMHWYRDFTKRLRSSFGGFGDMFADLIGATSAMTDVKQNYKNASEIATRFLNGEFDVELRKLEKHLAKGGKIADFPSADKIRSLSGQLFGVNSPHAMRALLGIWREAKTGSAPKTRNFAANLAGTSIRATIDSWAARTLQRLAGKPRIPPKAEDGVGGAHLKDPSVVGGAFGFGQKVFEVAAKKLSDSGVEITPSDLQAMMWFREKALWTKNDWTSQIGEEGSLEEEARRRELDRYQGLFSVQQGEEQPGVDNVARAVRTIDGVMKADPRVFMYRSIPTKGGYMDFGTEESFDLEAVVDREFDPMPLFSAMVREAKDNNQDSVGLSRVVRPDEDNANARPGIEVSLLKDTPEADVLRISNALRNAKIGGEKGIGAGGFTLAVDPRKRRTVGNRPAGEYVGIRVQFVPEIFIRAYHNGWADGPVADRIYDDLTSGDEARVQKVMQEARKALDATLAGLRSDPAVAYAEAYKYDTLLVGKEAYDDYAATGSGDFDSGAEGAVWPGSSAGERLRGAARRHAEANGIDPRSLRGGGISAEQAGEGQLRRDGGQLGGEGASGAVRQEVTPLASQTFPVPQVSAETPVFSSREQQPDAVTVVGVRYGYEKRTSLNGRSYGKGVPGQESLRIQAERDPELRQRLLNRVYFYAQTADELPRSESIITGNNVSRVKFTNLYDLAADPRGLYAQAKRETDNQQDAANRVEKLLLDAGFDGYLAKNAIPSPALVLIDIPGDIPAEYLGYRYQANEKLKAAAPKTQYDEVHHETIRKAIADGIAKFGGKGTTFADGTKVNIVPTEREVPQGALQTWLSEQGDGSIEGFYDPGSKEIWIITKNLSTPERAVFVATAHEVLHAGLRKTIGAENIDPVLRQIHARNKRVREQAAVRMSRGMPLVEAVEETLADMPDRSELKGWDKLLKAIKDFLAKIGIVRWTDEQVETLVAASRAAVREGGPQTVASTEEAIAASEKAPIFYSELSRQIAAAKMDNMPAPQWKAWLQNQQGIKKDELQWSGILDWLDVHTLGPEEKRAAAANPRAFDGKLSKADILGYLANNGVQVSETELGGPAPPEGFEPAYQSQDGKWVFLGTLGRRGFASIQIQGLGDTAQEAVIDAKMQIEKKARQSQAAAKKTDFGPGFAQAKEYFDQADSLDPYIEALAGKAPSGGTTKFHNYTLPGGKNYRELLLTLPEKGSSLDSMVGPGSVGGGGLFRSSHFDTPNIVAHVRFNERTDANGKRILFIEEIQSDWAQKGKREGFATKEPQGLTFVRAENEDGDSREPGTNRLTNEYVFRTPSGDAYSAWGDTREEAEKSLLEWLSKDNSRSRMMSGIPSAPFVTKTDAWVALALKRAIRYAADNGFDGIAWTTGTQQSERYDLSRQVDNVRAERYGEDNFSIQVRRGGEVVLSEHDISKSRVADLVGKDLADKFAEMKEGSNKTFSGLDLKVGGEGMRAFYDRIVPNVAKDVLKKVGGGQVGEVKMVNAKEASSLPQTLRSEGYDPESVTLNEILSDNGGRLPRWMTEEMAAELERGDFSDVRVKEASQPGFYLTPEMKAKATQGLPLFSKRKPKGLADMLSQMSNAAPEEKAIPEEFKGSSKWERSLKILEALSKDDDAFQFGKSDSRDMDTIRKEMGLTEIEKVEKKDSGWRIQMKGERTKDVDWIEPDGTPTTKKVTEPMVAFVSTRTAKLREFQSDDEAVRQAWLNIADMAPGKGGKQVYQLLYTWAANNGITVIPDPYKVSPKAMESRVANMLSAAMRLGTTKYMWPAGVVDVNDGYGWETPRWVDKLESDWKIVEFPGDDADRHNMRLLIEASLTIAKGKLAGDKGYVTYVDRVWPVIDPETGRVVNLDNIEYNFDSDQIVYGDTNDPVPQSTLDAIAEGLLPVGESVPLGGRVRPRARGPYAYGSAGAGADIAQAAPAPRAGAAAAAKRAIILRSALDLSPDHLERIAARYASGEHFVAGTPAAGLLASRRPDWVESGSADLKSAAAKVDTYTPDKTFKQKVDEMKVGWAERFVQGVFDAYAPLKRLGRKEYILARMVKSADASLEATLLYGKPRIDSDGVIHGDIDMKGFIGHMQDLKGEHDKFFLWVAGKRAARLMKEGRENLFTPKEIEALVKLDEGTMKDGSSRKQAYAKAQEALRGYNKAVLDIAEKTGLIDGESRKMWEHEFYVPFFRVNDDMKIDGPAKVKGLVRQKAFEKLKGGKENLGDLLDNTLRNWSHLLSASLANQAALANLKAAAKAGIATEVPESAAKDMVKSAGVGGATFAMEDGVKHWYIVDDAQVLDAISAVESASFKGLPMELMGKFKHYLTLGVTASPTFRVRNLMRDSISAIAQSDLSYNVAGNVWKGFKATDRKSKEYAEALFNGALIRFGQLTDGKHAEHAKRLILSGVDDATILDTPQKAKAALGAMWDWWQETGDRAENVNRMSRYMQGLARGESALEAAFASRDMMDFSLQGSWAATRFLTQIVPFMNARLQGMYKLGRAAKEDPARMGYVVGATALLSIALLLAYKDDDEWKKREDWDRDNYWWFRIGDKAFRIPKPFEIGAMGTLAERSVEMAISDEMTGKRFGERLRSMLGDTLSLNPTPQLFKPMIDIYANKDSFSGRMIESRGMENLTKPERVGPNTSLVAKTLGKVGETTQLSPAQIDFLIKSYFGWLGSHAAMTVDLMAQPFMDVEKPARKLDDVFVLGDFVKALPAGQSRYVEDFYKQAKVVHEVMGDLKRAREIHDMEKVREIMEERKDDIALARLYTGAERKIGEVNKRIRIVQGSNLSGELKRQRLDELEAQRAKLAEQVERIRTARRAAKRSPALSE